MLACCRPACINAILYNNLLCTPYFAEEKASYRHNHQSKKSSFPKFNFRSYWSLISITVFYCINCFWNVILFWNQISGYSQNSLGNPLAWLCRMHLSLCVLCSVMQSLSSISERITIVPALTQLWWRSDISQLLCLPACSWPGHNSLFLYPLLPRQASETTAITAGSGW